MIDSSDPSRDLDRFRRRLISAAAGYTLVVILGLWTFHGRAPVVPLEWGALAYFPACGIVLASAYLAHRGAVEVAAQLFVGFLWTGVTAVVVLQGGLLASFNVIGYLTVVIFAGLLGGRRPLAWMAGLTAVACTVVAVLEGRGGLPSPSLATTPFSALLSLLGAISVVGVLISTARREVERSQLRLIESQKLLQSSLHEARTHRATLERDFARLEQLAELCRALSASSEREGIHEVADHLRAMTGAFEVGLAVERGEEMVSLLDPPDPELQRRLRILSGDLRVHGTLLLDRTPGEERSSIFVSVAGQRVRGVMWLRRAERLDAADVSFVSAVASVVAGFLERQLADQAAVESQKLEAVGRLARSVAHDFNNVLTTLRSSTELARDELEDPNAPVRAYLDEIDKAGEHATALVAQLTTMNRREGPELAVVPLAKLTRELAPLLRRLAGNRHPLLLEVARKVGCVRGDGTQLEQILLNLVANARDASRLGGRIWVRVDSNPFSVFLEVQDEGAGMTESVRQRAPEAFFTTKKKGTGLGLATAHDIVASYGGTLRIDSHVGQGTTVRIELPRLVDTASAQPSLDLAR